MVFNTPSLPESWQIAEGCAGLRSFAESDTCPLLDVEHAVDGFGGNVDAFRAVVRVFLTYLPGADAALSESPNAEELIPLLHDLGSSFGSVGAMRAYHLSRTMEARLRRGETAGITESTALLQAAVRASTDALRASIAVDEPSSGP